MKKNNIVGMFAALAIAAAAMSVPVMAQTGEITEAQARQIALENAGLAESDVVFVRCGLDYDDGVKQYEIEFYSGNMEYDYDICAANGAILSVDRDCEYYTPAAQNTTAASGITKDQALEIAAKHAGVAKENMSYVSVKPDFDDGRQTFDVKFYVGMTEYSYDIDAASGQILDFDMDMEMDD